MPPDAGHTQRDQDPLPVITVLYAQSVPPIPTPASPHVAVPTERTPSPEAIDLTGETSSPAEGPQDSPPNIGGAVAAPGPSSSMNSPAPLPLPLKRFRARPGTPPTPTPIRNNARNALFYMRQKKVRVTRIETVTELGVETSAPSYRPSRKGKARNP
ncbi:hypothetical protein PQX77_015969 [Marasmius sp. AFHP31]|nr:hypothetical protein PQX77_015969 [Marasmius sp. AFHP31]